MASSAERTRPAALARRRVGSLRSAAADLLDRELAPSRGHLVAGLTGCVFAPSMLTFWAVNGVLDVSIAIALGAAGGPGGLWLRVVAYALLVPVYLLVRMAYYLLHPVHRETVLSGGCPDARLVSLDWLGVGILTTGLPLSLVDAGPWLAMNAVFVAGLFVLPRALPPAARTPTKLASIALGSGLFLYTDYAALLGSAVGVPAPAAVGFGLGAVASLRLSATAADALFAVFNSLLTGPVVVALFALALNRILSRPELTSIPAVRHTLPERDPARVVLASAAVGTAVYLGLVAAVTGEVGLVP